MENSDKVDFRYFGMPSEFRVSDEWNLPIQWEPISRLGREKMIGATEVFICNVPPGEQQALLFRSPQSVQGIHFEGRISQHQFETLVIPLVNLTTLDVHLSSLCHLTLKHTHLTLDLLTNLQISSTNFSSTDAGNCDMELVLENAIFLINLNFPRMNYLALSVPTLSSKESAWTHAIIRSLTRNSQRIKYLNLESPFPIVVPPENMDSRQRFKCSPASLAELQEVALKSFHYWAAMETGSTSFWKEFSLGQNELEYYHFWIQSHCAFPLTVFEDILRNNRGTIGTIAVNNLELETDELNGAGAQPPLLNGSVFQHCAKLRILYIMGDVGLDAPGTDQGSRRPSFKHFNLLPYSLETLRLHNLVLSMSDAKFISNNLQNLTHLELVNVGEEGNLGLNLENLPTLLAKKKMERVEVVRGINRGSLQVSPEDKAGWKGIAKVLFQKQGNKSSFRVERDPAEKTFQLIQNESEDEEEGSYAADGDGASGESEFASSSETLAAGQNRGRSLGRHEIHREETSRLSNSNARELYANLNFNHATSSDQVNQNKSQEK